VDAAIGMVEGNSDERSMSEASNKGPNAKVQRG
jgi:hypothetical protein